MIYTYNYIIIYYIATRIALLVLPNLSCQSCFSLAIANLNIAGNSQPRLASVDAARYKV